MTDVPSSAPVLGGLAIAATGVAHFVAPQAFRGITTLVYPENTETWTFRNGVAETLIGIAIAVPRTRSLGWAGLAAYGAVLGMRAVITR
ncbi:MULTISPECIES: hypothetical protein [Rhodococcus]|uniref:Uncharacterized protein n=1 Tax=Rhodococcus oxybenzonivorans TaxID=1990687 RepID=A0AAE5A6Q3_9NOCA|nr:MULTISPECIES: hypothetical protein [Rhodococcus]MDV7241675.1 hypothetical protein [Rhodococcus oxybenzonivorans]MDV7264714.1 hypothetical protein [Rhodococcus oxybenzonivorans]MDV7273791.1 hypothetical protein [Rhodococcus oxybenzonivorans]MDV7333957.1 hypothetical protein [Rhodococcus oxybenzonivorans]MDV7343376.1 hypothetical protein [Rhodococcus oxybenzonivorans]